MRERARDRQSQRRRRDRHREGKVRAHAPRTLQWQEGEGYEREGTGAEPEQEGREIGGPYPHPRGSGELGVAGPELPGAPERESGGKERRADREMSPRRCPRARGIRHGLEREEGEQCERNGVGHGAAAEVRSRAGGKQRAGGAGGGLGDPRCLHRFPSRPGHCACAPPTGRGSRILLRRRASRSTASPRRAISPGASAAGSRARSPRAARSAISVTARIAAA